MTLCETKSLYIVGSRLCCRDESFDAIGDNLDTRCRHIVRKCINILLSCSM